MEELEVLLYREGRSTPFSEWLASLKDGRTVGIVRARLNRIRLGNFGGSGVEELRIDFGPDYRVYYGRDGALAVILLCGGTKGTQARDILRAKGYWRKYLHAQKTG